MKKRITIISLLCVLLLALVSYDIMAAEDYCVTALGSCASTCSSVALIGGIFQIFNPGTLTWAALWGGGCTAGCGIGWADCELGG